MSENRRDHGPETRPAELLRDPPDHTGDPQPGNSTVTGTGTTGRSRVCGEDWRRGRRGPPRTTHRKPPCPAPDYPPTGHGRLLVVRHLTPVPAKGPDLSGRLVRPSWGAPEQDYLRPSVRRPAKGSSQPGRGPVSPPRREHLTHRSDPWSPYPGRRGVVPGRPASHTRHVLRLPCTCRPPHRSMPPTLSVLCLGTDPPRGRQSLGCGPRRSRPLLKKGFHVEGEVEECRTRVEPSPPKGVGSGYSGRVPRTPSRPTH